MINSIATEAGFMQMYDYYYGKIYNYVFFQLLNKENTEDLLSEIFLKVFEHRTSFDAGKAKLSTWLFTITKNTVSDYLRKRMHAEHWEPVEEELIDANTDVEAAYIQKSDSEYILESLRKLNKNDRCALFLKYFMNFNYREVASHLGISEKNASVLLTRALRRLKTSMDNRI